MSDPWRWGLVSIKHKLCWSSDGHLRWLPESVTQHIMTFWNFVACRVYGHYWLPDPCYPYLESCTDCLKTRRSRDPVGFYLIGDRFYEIRAVARVNRAQVPWIWSKEA